MKCSNCGNETKTIICENCGVNVVEKIKQNDIVKGQEKETMIKELRKINYILASAVGFFICVLLFEKNGTLETFSWLTFWMLFVTLLFGTVVFGSVVLLIVTFIANKGIRPHKCKSKWFEIVVCTLIFAGLYCYLYLPWSTLL